MDPWHIAVWILIATQLIAAHSWFVHRKTHDRIEERLWALHLAFFPWTAYTDEEPRIRWWRKFANWLGFAKPQQPYTQSIRPAKYRGPASKPADAPPTQPPPPTWPPGHDATPPHPPAYRALPPPPTPEPPDGT